MQLRYGIMGMGLCIGSVENTHRLIEYIAGNSSVREREGLDCQNEAIEEAFVEIDKNASIYIYTDRKILSDVLKPYNIVGERYVESLYDVLDEERTNMHAKADYIVLLAHSERQVSGCAVVVLGKTTDWKAELRWIEEEECHNDIEQNLFQAEEFFSDLVNLIIGNIEVTCGLHLMQFQAKGENDITWKSTDKVRYLKINTMEGNGKISIREPLVQEKRKINCKSFIIPLSFQTEDQLKKKLLELEEKLNNTTLNQISIGYLDEYIQNQEFSRTISFLAEDKVNLVKEIETVRNHSAKFMSKNYKWRTSGGSFYQYREEASENKIVFLNPPGGMTDLGSYYRMYSYFYYVRDAGTNREMKETNLQDMLARYLQEAAMNHQSILMAKYLGIQVNQMVGASMGEMSLLLYENMIQSKVKKLSQKEHSILLNKIVGKSSELLKQQKELGKRYFECEAELPDKWYLMCPVEKVREAIKDEKKVFIFLIGSPRDVIICGEQEACKRVIAKLNCMNVKVNDPTYIHTPVMGQAYDEIVEFMLALDICIDVKNLPYTLYSTYFKRKMDDSCRMLAENFAHIFSDTVDLPGVLETAYQDGGRIYIDLSAGQLCTGWAKEFFRNHDDVEVLSFYSKEEVGEHLLRILAILLSYHADVEVKNFIRALRFPATCEKEGITNAMPNKVMDDILVQQAKNNLRAFQLYMENDLNLLRRMNKPQKKILWDRDEIIHMTEISMADILGEQYRKADSYLVRARMPSPPFLFVSRITDIKAKFGVLDKSSITIEYDIPADFKMKKDANTISSIFAGEASHIGIFLAAYIGIDIISEGKLKFRITDVTTTCKSEREYRIGDTMRMHYGIDRVLRNGKSILVFCSYRIYIKDCLMTETKAVGGFFTQKELEQSKGIIEKEKPKVQGTPLFCYVDTKKNQYTKDETRRFFLGEFDRCFDAQIPFTMSNKREEDAIMCDEILEINYAGGDYNSGYICGRKEIVPNFWVFQAHFKNDPILPGTMMLEGLYQTAQFLFASAGLLGVYEETELCVAKDSASKVSFRGQVQNISSNIYFQVHVKELVQNEKGIYITTFGKVIWNGKLVIYQENMVYHIKKKGCDTVGSVK